MMGVGTIALIFSGFKFSPALGYKGKIGLQLYTLRKLFEKDFAKTMQRIADIGIVGIESYPLPENITLEYSGKILREVGLKVLAMHTELPLGGHRDAVLKTAEAYESEMVVFPGWPEADQYKTVDATKHMVEVYNETAAFLKTRGLRFGLHNHWWEFEKSDGIYPFYYLLENLTEEIFFEIDTYWVKTGGLDPAKVVKDFGERAPLLHIKDGPAIKGESAYAQVPAGEGSLDFPAIVEAGGENVRWMIIEFDEFGKDIFEGITKSYNFLSRNGLAEGRI